MTTSPTLTVLGDHDTDVWVLWSPDHGPEWPQEEAALCFSETDEPYDDDQVAGLAAQLQVVAEQLGGNPSIAAGFVHLPAPAQGSGFVVTVQLLLPCDGSEDALVDVATGRQQGLSEPTVEPFEGDLGTGLRVQYHLQAADGTVVDNLVYVWHRPDLGTDVRVAVGSAFLGELLDAEHEVEELVRTLDVVPDGE